MGQVRRTQTPSDVDAAIRRIRNRLRKYSARSIVVVALRELWTDRGSEVKNLEAAPWIALLLAKWALADEMVYLEVGQPMPPQVFDRLRQEVWDIPTTLELPGRDRGLHGLLRPMLQQQMEFQRPHGWGFLRWPALIARRPAADALSQRFRDSLGMDPRTYMDLAWPLYASIVSGKPVVPETFFEPLRPRYQDAVDQLLALFVRDLTSLRTELAKADALNVRGRPELREFAYLRRFPFVRLAPGQLACWHPAVLGRGLEDAVHLRLSEHGEQYTRPFSRVFEEYVTDLALQANPSVVTEDAYATAVGAGRNKVEALVRTPSCNVLVEAKMALFADAVLVTDHPDAIYMKTKRVYEAIHQGWKVTQDLSQPESPFFRENVENFLIVVTSRQLHLGYGTMLADLYPTGRLAYPDQTATQRLPLHHVFILSIEEFERLMGCVREGEADLELVLRTAARDNADASTAKMYFEHHIRQHTQKFPKPPLIADAIAACRKRLELVLPGASDAMALANHGDSATTSLQSP